MKSRNLLIILNLLLVVSCSKLTLQNYDKLKTGMSYDEVVNIIGKPGHCKEKLGARQCQWGEDGTTQITTSFIAGSAVFYSHENLLK